MVLPFSPRDLPTLAQWSSAAVDRVVFWDGSTTKIRVWRDRHVGRFPWFGRDHGETGVDAFRRSPSLGTRSVDRLGGRSTLSFLAGQYVVGGVDPALDGVLPSDNQRRFLLCRFSPPTDRGPGDARYGAVAAAAGYQDGRKPGAGLWTPGLRSRSTAGLEFVDWDPARPTAPGVLRFSDAWELTFRRSSSAVPGKPAPVSVTFDSFGQWTLLEIVQTASHVRLLVNGATRATIARVASPAVWDYAVGESAGFAPALHSTADPTLYGDLASVDLCSGGGNVAETIAFGSSLSDDEAAKVRAWIAQQWGLEGLLPGQPYVGSEIPGSDPVVPWAFPGIRPTARVYVPGLSPNTPFRSVGGVEQRVRHSRRIRSGDRLSLSYRGLSEAEVGRVLDHYEGRLGGFLTFCLRPETLAGLGAVAPHLTRERTRAELAPDGASWGYAGEPTVVNRLRNVNDLDVELELRPESFGLEFPATGQGLEIRGGGGLLFARRQPLPVGVLEIRGGGGLSVG